MNFNELPVGTQCTTYGGSILVKKLNGWLSNGGICTTLTSCLGTCWEYCNDGVLLGCESYKEVQLNPHTIILPTESREDWIGLDRSYALSTSLDAGMLRPSHGLPPHFSREIYGRLLSLSVNEALLTHIQLNPKNLAHTASRSWSVGKLEVPVYATDTVPYDGYTLVVPTRGETLPSSMASTIEYSGGCAHQWVETAGFSRIYKDCKLCKAKWEDTKNV